MVIHDWCDNSKWFGKRCRGYEFAEITSLHAHRRRGSFCDEKLRRRRTAGWLAGWPPG